MKNDKILVEYGSIAIHLLLIFLDLYIADMEERHLQGSYDCCGISHVIKESKTHLKDIEHRFYI